MSLCPGSGRSSYLLSNHSQNSGSNDMLTCTAGSFLARWVLVVQVLPQLRGAAEALGFEDIGDVTACQDDDGVDVFADLGVGLGIKVGSGDEHAELAVAQPGDQAAGFADADAVAWCVAFGFQRELDGDRIAARAEEVVTDCVASAIAPGPGDVDLADVGLAGAPQVGGELLEAGWPVLEMLIHQGRSGACRLGVVLAGRGGG